jgi:flagellar basal-body rod protein FlgC
VSIDALTAATRAGLANEQARIQNASTRIATANVALPATHFAAGLETGTRKVQMPSHPQADASGYVHYPDVDVVAEMISLMEASRGYEANVRAFNTLRTMIGKALDIGVQR